SPAAQDSAEDYDAQDGPQNGQNGPDQECIAKTLVATRDTRKRRARPQARRVQADQREENRGFAQALRRTELAPQVRRLSVGAIDVDLLHQSRRQDLAEDAADAAGTREDRTEAPVRKRVTAVLPGEQAERTSPSVFPNSTSLSRVDIAFTVTVASPSP